MSPIPKRRRLRRWRRLDAGRAVRGSDGGAVASSGSGLMGAVAMGDGVEVRVQFVGVVVTGGCRRLAAAGGQRRVAV
jgi:hypothetical protein